jgi:hypothetical protein
VREWLENYQEGTGRKATITLGCHKHRNGSQALYVSLVSYRSRGTAEHVHSHETCWYYPSSRYVSLPALCIGLIHSHEKETDALEAKWAKQPWLRPDEVLPPL